MGVAEGNVPHDSPDAGSPVKGGGLATTGSRSAVADGDRVDGHFDELGKQGVFIGADGGTAIAAVLTGDGDGKLSSRNKLNTESVNNLYNGATIDRQRGNTELTLLASAARTATVQSSDQVNYNHRGVIITIDVTSVSDTPTITMTVEIKDSIGNTYNIILTAVGITATGRFVFVIYPSTLTAAAGGITQVVQNPLPRTWRINMVHTDSDSITYSVDAAMIL